MTGTSTVVSVGIVGCGWLGTVLAKNLLSQKINVLATRSKQDNLAKLTEQGIAAQVLLLPASTIESAEKLQQHQVFKQQCLVIAITPQFKQGRADYGEKIAQLVNAAKQQGHVQRIILLSSSAVYNGLYDVVNEESALDLAAEKVKILHDAEQAVLDFSVESAVKKSYVLRLAGLVGPNRHPGKFLANSTMLKTPDAAVNLIHQQDAQGLILSLLKTDVPTGIFNGVSDTHVSKKIYYQTAATALSLPEPKFIDEDIDDELAIPRRIVSGDKAQQLLSYQFVYPDLLTWL